MATLYQDAEAWNAVSRFRRLSNVQSMASSTVLDYDEDDNATSPTISVMAKSSREKNASGGFGFSTEEPGIYPACFAEDGGNRDGEESSSHDINSLAGGFKIERIQFQFPISGNARFTSAYLIAGSDSLHDVGLQVRDITTNPEWERADQYGIPVLAKVLSNGSEKGFAKEGFLSPHDYQSSKLLKKEKAMIVLFMKGRIIHLPDFPGRPRHPFW
ncbi:hypothetical protein SDJN03_14244, partial [Cucurbita argyrosperma subsp. sororia]